VLSPLGL